MLPQKKRVTTALFKEILAKSSSFHGTALSLRLIKMTTPSPSRFSVYVPKKAFKLATDRNKYKRKVNACLRALYPSIKPSFVGVFFVKAAISTFSPQTIAAEAELLLKKSNLI